MEEIRRQALAIAARILWRPEDAADVAQEVVVRVLKVRADGSPAANERAFAARTAVHLSIDRLRAMQQQVARLPLIAEARAVGPGTAVPPEEVQRLYAAIAALPAKQAAVITLRKLMELEYADVAELLGISVESCRSHCRLALRRLREVLGEKG